MRQADQKWRKLVQRSFCVAGAVLLVRGVLLFKKDHFAVGKAVLQKAYTEAGTLSAEVMMPLLSYDKTKEADDWVENLLQAVQEQIPAMYEVSKTTESGQDSGKTAAKTAETPNEAQKKEEEKTEAVEPAEKEETTEGQEEQQKPGEETENKSGTAEKTRTESEIQKEESEETVQAGGMPKTIYFPEAEVKQQIINPEELSDDTAVRNRFFVVDPNTEVRAGQIHAQDLLQYDFTLEQKAEPQILLYHTHSQERFADSRENVEEDSIVGVGNELEQILRGQYGYEVLHLKDTFDLAEGQLNRSRAYQYAEPVVAQTLEEHPSIEVVIDLHRDGVDDAKRLVTEIAGRKTAQIMFFNGLSYTREQGELSSLPNPYIEDNLAFSFQLEYLAEQYYPDFARCIYLKGYRYNLHMRPRSILLEAGAQTNTVEEVKNAMGPFADILHKVLEGS